MARFVLSTSLALALLTTGPRCLAGAADPVKLAPEKADLSLVVKFRFPSEMESSKCLEIMKKVKGRGATHQSIRVSKAGEGTSAEVEVQPQTPSKRVAAVVEELLGCGITKISIDVKK